VVSEVKILCNFAKSLSIVFSLVGVVAIIVALDRLFLGKDVYRTASFIKNEDRKENKVSAGDF